MEFDIDKGEGCIFNDQIFIQHFCRAHWDNFSIIFPKQPRFGGCGFMAIAICYGNKNFLVGFVQLGNWRYFGHFMAIIDQFF